MIAALMLSASSAGLSTGLPAAEQQRIGVYVLAAIVGLLVTGAISCAKVARRRAGAVRRKTTP